MPANAPGSLSQQEYLQVTTHILLQNNKILATIVISLATLNSISLA
jgi:hypothetical protein